MEPFDLREYLANPSRKVVTRDGKNVRIRCTDAKGECPVIGLVDCKDNEIPLSFTEKGRIGVNVPDSDVDLFFSTKNHEGWINLYRNFDGKIFGGNVFATKDDAKYENNLAIATIKIEWEE